MPPPTGYDYVAIRNLKINGVLAFRTGQYVPDTTVTSQSWVVGVDVVAFSSPIPGPSGFVPEGPTAPDPASSTAWVDTSTSPPVLKGWDGSAWVAIGGGGGGGSSPVTTVATSGATQTVTIPASAAIVEDITLTANCTITLAGATAGVMCQATLILRQDITGSRTVTWPSSVLWATGGAPILSTTPTYADIVTLFSVDGGTSWFGALNGSSYQPSAVPNAPTGLAATGGNASVSLSWSAVLGASPAVTGYKVYRGTSSGTETLLATIGNVTTYSDTGRTNGTTYYYKVKATNAIGDSTLSSEASATPAAGGSLPTTTPMPVQWFKADAITGLTDGQAVSSWVDSSSSPLPATQATGANQPLYKTNIVNALPVVRFDGVNDSLASTYNVPGNSVTIFVVAKPAASGSTYVVTGTDVGGGVCTQITSTSHLDLVLQGISAEVDSAGAGGVTTTGFHVLMAIKEDGSATKKSSVAIDGTVTLAASNSGLNSVSGAALWLAAQSAAPQSYLNGDIAEVIVYAGVLSSTDITAVKTYLAGKYGITVV